MRTKDYSLMVDIETANHTEDALAYDVGIAVVDNYGNIYEQYSYICFDIFFREQDLMKSAYYAHKIPIYYKGIENGTRKVASLYEIRSKVHELHNKYKYKYVCAYNGYFDVSGLNRTIRWVTKSKCRYFFPYGVEYRCVWHMACQVICTQKKYYTFCIDNNFVSKSGNISTSAGTVYRFITNNPTFEENHTGLEDVLIETQIMAECFRKHKKMKKNIYRACWRIPQRKATK